MTTKPDTYPTAGVFRRLAALVYDFLLLCSMWMLVAAIVLFTVFGGNAPEEARYLQLTVLPICIIVTYLFYAWCWTHGGQTLGMQAWRIRTVTQDGKPLSIKLSLIRSTIGGITILLGGIGFWYAFLNPQKLSLQDLVSKTCVILLPPKKKQR